MAKKQPHVKYSRILNISLFFNLAIEKIIGNAINDALCSKYRNSICSEYKSDIAIIKYSNGGRRNGTVHKIVLFVFWAKEITTNINNVKVDHF